MSTGLHAAGSEIHSVGHVDGSIAFLARVEDVGSAGEIRRTEAKYERYCHGKIRNENTNTK